jgi:predicted HTH transcriptional regulator
MTEAVQENTEPLQPFACDGRIGEEKLFELLGVGGEYPALDFKRELDLNNSGKKLDFIKDCAAMMNLPRGGYLIVGAEDNGTPARYVDALSKEMFDSARLTQLVKGYVDGAVDIRSQVHNVEIQKTSASFALIYVAPPADGIPAIMSKNGVVAGERGNKPVFHQGMVFTREGTTNALVRHQTWNQVLHNLRERSGQNPGQTWTLWFIALFS